MTVRPSTAETTEIAGVIIASPKKKAAPTMPRKSANPPFRFSHCLDENDEREDAAFTAVVGAHQQEDVFERDDEDQRPDEERGDADHIVAQAVGASAGDMVERFAHRIERAGADVAEDDAERGKGQLAGYSGCAPAGSALAGLSAFGCDMSRPLSGRSQA